MHLGSFRVWRVPIGGYKIHGEKMASFSQIPSITSSMFTFGIEKQPIQVIVQPHAFRVIFDLTENTNDDDIIPLMNILVEEKNSKFPSKNIIQTFFLS